MPASAYPGFCPPAFAARRLTRVDDAHDAATLGEAHYKDSAIGGMADEDLPSARTIAVRCRSHPMDAAHGQRRLVRT